MTALIWDTQRSSTRGEAGVALGSATFLALVLLRLAIQYATSGALFLEDDAFYYTVIAQHIAQSGVSTFDGQTLTNGYHPLWLALLVLQDLTVGPSLFVTIALELGLATTGVALLLTTLHSRSVLFHLLFAVALAVATRPFIARGMEISLLVFALRVFTRAVVAYRAGSLSGVTLGLATGLCIGSRVDAAVFVLPIALLAARNLRDGARIILPVALAGIVYAGANLAIFGIAFPISGAIKSLGGLQVNVRLLHQLWLEATPAGTVSLLAFANALIGRCLLCFALCLVALPFTRRGSIGRLLVLGYLVGLTLFSTKLLFGSSWLIWPWYTFPVVVGLTALFHAVDGAVAEREWALAPRWDAALAVLLVFGAGWQLRAGAARVLPNFELINRQAVARLSPTFRGERIAMGDRAGSMAALYAGPVTQLEGLVNDKTYLEALGRGDDLKPLLCRRGVRFVLSYQQDLGDYQTAAVPVIRPWLTSFKSPTLTFSKADEVGRVSDLAVFDNRGREDEGDNYLYAWRLAGCDALR